MLILDKRPCRLGTSINGRRQLHGEEPVAAIDLQLTGFMLTKAELGELLQEPRAHDMLFVAASDGRPAEPLFPMIKALKLKDKIEGASVTIELTDETTVKLTDCKLARIELERETGGLTAMSFQLQSVPTLDSSLARIFEKLDCEVHASLRASHGKQESLGLNAPASEKNGNGADARAVSRTGRKILAAAHRAKRKSASRRTRAAH